MNRPKPTHAETLALHGQKIAALATEHLLRTYPAIKDRFHEDPLGHWRDHFMDRVEELSESLATGEPQIFAAHVKWASQAMAARTLDTTYLDATFLSLRHAIESVLTDDASDSALICLDNALTQFNAGDTSGWESALDPTLPLDRLALRYVQMVVAGNVWPGMQTVLDALDTGSSVEDLYLKVLLPAQAEVGRLWHLNEITIAEERLVSSTTQRLMAVLSTHAGRKPDRGKTVIASAVAGNAHDIGIRAIAYLMEMQGWRTIFLGSDMPRSDLPAAVKFYEADLVMLSIALSTQLSALKKTIAEIRAACGTDAKIMVGGNGLRAMPDLWRDLGADGFTENVLDAIELAGHLTGG
jgi:methanogenic corrinoid protein MtbC1